MVWDHPRSRGVYSSSVSPSGTLLGSSPLARGLRDLALLHRLPEGIIPARAGFTSGTPSPSRSWSDHPRSRGVYAPGTASASWLKGSSPLARGLRGVEFLGGDFARIIPARAGFTHILVLALLLTGGSSPLARGLRVADIRDSLAVGIIPARAGFTHTSNRPPAQHGDHPRSRGVYADLTVILLRHYWIIPARAGFTFMPLARMMRMADHPRSRGVYSSTTIRSRLLLGSSPLARGLPGRRGQERVTDRIIPARAGFTIGARHSGRVGQDHPRSRGVYDHYATEYGHLTGSSPLARGLRDSDNRRSVQPGIIPARAGFTPLPYRPALGRPGSSPLARGLPWQICCYIASAGIIPARAGFTHREL